MYHHLKQLKFQLERRVEREEKYFKGRKELLREVRRSRSPPERRFTEEKSRDGRRRDDRFFLSLST